VDFLDFCLAVWAYKETTPCSVTSWGRTQAHNHFVGGMANSMHVHWKAVDVVYDSLLPLARRQDAARAAGLILIAEDDHDHLMAALD